MTMYYKYYSSVYYYNTDTETYMDINHRSNIPVSYSTQLQKLSDICQIIINDTRDYIHQNNHKILSSAARDNITIFVRPYATEHKKYFVSISDHHTRIGDPAFGPNFSINHEEYTKESLTQTINQFLNT